MTREAGEDRMDTPGGWWAPGPWGAPPQSPGQAKVSPQGPALWCLAQGQVGGGGGGVSRSQYSKPLAPAGLGRARLKVEGPLCLGGHLGFTSPKAQTGNCGVLVVAFISF